MSGLNKGTGKVEVRLRWDPSPLGSPASDLDIIAATYLASDPHGAPAYIVHFDSRAPDGTITLNRDSTTGKGLGSDEIMTFETDRLGDEYGWVVVGVVIQQRGGRMVFGDVTGTGVRVVEDRYTELAAEDFGGVADCTAAVIGEFVRGESGDWRFHPLMRGYDADPTTFAETMGRARS